MQRATVSESEDETRGSDWRGIGEMEKGIMRNWKWRG